MQKAFTQQIKSFGIEIKRQREIKGLTQQDLADRCDIDVRTIQRIERGEHGVGLQILFAMALALETTPTEMLSKIKMPAAGKPRL
ncbi:MAG: helix-turn-helix transcriptional regulator [Bacteroidetes bacterium]|nr:helix-turn-helix transcriptional regulator [Bacteroidota bacterium]